MSGQYLTWLVEVLRAAGCNVSENATTAGWQNRARSSGGFPSTPLGVQWHHTASNTTPANDLSWMINGSDDAPIGNLLLDRNGVFWPIAAGAANTAGKGGPLTMSRGTIPIDSANTRSVAIEAANNGVGEGWSAPMMDAYFKGSNAINARLGNLPTDVFNHNTWAPSRKIDPATAGAVQGSWRPKETTSSGTWSQVDVCNECNKRAGVGPSPGPSPIPLPPSGDNDVDKYLCRDVDGMPWVTDFASYATALTEDQGARGRDIREYISMPDNNPWPLDQQDTDLMHRLAER